MYLKDLPLISIVMPSLNQAEFIEAAISSVLSQEYTRLELIVADGGSTDGTLDILHRLQQADRRLVWFSGPDSGPAEALNRAFAKVRGTLIGWLNADDSYLPGAVARSVYSFQANPLWLMLYGHGQHIDETGMPLHPYPTLPPGTHPEQFLQGCFICQPTVFLRRTLYLLLGKLDESLKTAFDFDYWLRAFKFFTGRIGFVDALQAQSRLHKNCITLRHRRTVILEGMQVLSKNFDYAPKEWVLTYANEVISGKISAEPSTTLRETSMSFLESVRSLLTVEDYNLLRVQLKSDERLAPTCMLPPDQNATLALLAADIPMTMLNFPPGNDIPQNDRSMESHVSEHGDYRFNIFCMTALENGRYCAKHGCSQFKGRYNIGYWPWELEKWPDAWKEITSLLDEVWVSTQHTYDSLAPITSLPVHIMPMAVDLGPVSRKGRRFFRLPDKPFLFCFSFDLNSSMHRKNPQACLDAFTRAFPPDSYGNERVGLVIKAHRPSALNQEWESLKGVAAKDRRIIIIEQTLPRPDLLALYKACDCFLSLHRAEGFGRGIAEALLLGLEVFATGYSGNVDFCSPPHAHLVDYRLVKVKKGQYPYSQGQVWAEPDIDHAAELMRQLVDAKRSRKGKKSDQWSEFSISLVGDRYRRRLLEISETLNPTA